MSKKDAVKEAIEEAEAFLKFCNSKDTYVCPQCDFEVGYLCEFCQSLEIIARLKNSLKDERK